jgi:hypothetical protein
VRDVLFLLALNQGQLGLDFFIRVEFYDGFGKFQIQSRAACFGSGTVKLL